MGCFTSHHEEELGNESLQSGGKPKPSHETKKCDHCGRDKHNRATVLENKYLNCAVIGCFTSHDEEDIGNESFEDYLYYEDSWLNRPPEGYHWEQNCKNDIKKTEDMKHEKNYTYVGTGWYWGSSSQSAAVEFDGMGAVAGCGAAGAGCGAGGCGGCAG